MLTSRNVFALALLGLILDLGVSETLMAQESAVSFLRITNSPRANGMGGCVVTMVSEESAYYNPASIGLLHLDRTVSFVAPHSTKWLPEWTDDMPLKSWSASVGVSRKLLEKSGPGQDNISLGLAYSYTRLNYESFERASETGASADQHESYDAVSCLAVGFGWQHKVRIGLGYAIKFIDSRLGDSFPGMGPASGNADGTAHQFGLMVALPLHELTFGDEPQSDAPTGKTEIEITPTFACVFDNLGKDLEYADAAQSDKLPKMRRLGLSLLVAAVAENSEYCSFRASWESEKLLVGHARDQMKAGVEIGILGAFFARSGVQELDGVRSKLSTHGLGFRLRGLLPGASRDDAGNDDRGFGAYLARHFDLTVDYARYGSKEDNALSKTWFYAISLSL
ncbi:MAG: hypothetical protein NTW07_00155 [candidate division Zixibacteria bacterium]|nr:hypothetical protein [candidate division Zixibacteria bacterium]